MPEEEIILTKDGKEKQKRSRIMRKVTEEEFYEIINEEEKKNKQQYEENIASAVNSLVNEAARHFLSDRPRTWDDECRYIYNKLELEQFELRFVALGGKLKDLTIRLMSDGKEMDAWEIYRSKYERELIKRELLYSF